MLFHTNRDLGDEHAATVTVADRDGHEHRIVHRYPGSSDQYTHDHAYPHGDAGDRADPPADDDGGTAGRTRPPDGETARDAVTLHSPLPWRIIPSVIPYSTWICDAEGGCVALGFSHTDERVLLNAPVYRHAIEAAVVAFDAGRIVRARAILRGALMGMEAGADGI